MDPITGAIMAVAPALASEEIIRRKWGEKSPIETAVEAVEAKPESQGKAAVLQEEIASVAAAQDPELMAAVQKLIEALKEDGVGGKALEGVNITISGGTVQGVVGSQNVKIESMNFGAPPSGKT